MSRKLQTAGRKENPPKNALNRTKILQFITLIQKNT